MNFNKITVIAEKKTTFPTYLNSKKNFINTIQFYNPYSLQMFSIF